MRKYSYGFRKISEFREGERQQRNYETASNNHLFHLYSKSYSYILFHSKKLHRVYTCYHQIKFHGFYEIFCSQIEKKILYSVFFSSIFGKFTLDENQLCITRDEKRFFINSIITNWLKNDGIKIISFAENGIAECEGLTKS